MGWRIFDTVVFASGLIISAVLFVNEFVYDFGLSNAYKTIFLSFVFGIIMFFIFVVIARLFYIVFRDRTKETNANKDERRSKNVRRVHIAGIFIFILFVGIFLNSYLYVKALLGNDMLVSLKIDDKNIFLKNGEGGQINVKAKILMNPFCRANCSLVMEDLSNDEIKESDNIYLRYSSPISKEYFVNISENNSGQKFYRAKLECSTAKTLLCYVADENSKSRTEIISVNHELNDIQKINREKLKNQTEKINNEFYSVGKGLENMNFNYYFLDLSELKNESYELNKISINLSKKISNLNDFYISQKYSELEKAFPEVETEVNKYKKRSDNLNLVFNQEANEYNSLVNEVNTLHNERLYSEDHNFSDDSLLIAELYVRNFNSLIEGMENYSTLEYKKILFYNLEESRKNLTLAIANESGSNISGEKKINISIFPINFPLIKFAEKNYSFNFTLAEPTQICCFKNECYKCVDDSSVNFPIILVHGHSFNEKISAELSLEAFSDFSKKLEEEGYIDAGNFYGNQYDELSKGYLGKINNSVVLKTTYYIDTLVSDEGSFILESKGDNIDKYSERLNEIISNVKYLTGKDKVIVVAHSMGGLVARKYIQKYGENSVDKIILVGVPNKGVDGRVMGSCSILGANAECEDLYENSYFLADLNSAPLPNIPIYNIVGVGCFWEGSNGDGIVKNESAYLEGAQNIFAEGTCDGLNFFHVDLIKPEEYPGIYEIVKEKISS